MGRFCTGAIEDATYGGSQKGPMWAIALGLSIISVHFLSNFGLINSLESLYFQLNGTIFFSSRRSLDMVWQSVAIGYGALARLGGGDLRSFVLF